MREPSTVRTASWDGVPLLRCSARAAAGRLFALVQDLGQVLTEATLRPFCCYAGLCFIDYLVPVFPSTALHASQLKAEL